MAKQTNIEDNFLKLDEIITALEKGEASLEDSFKLYNEGMKLVRSCNTQLDKIEKQIIVLNENGEEDGI